MCPSARGLVLLLWMVALPQTVCEVVDITWTAGFSDASARQKTVAAGDQLRFSWSGTHNVYKMKDKTAFIGCDFTGATNLGDTSPVQFVMGSTTEYFACQVGTHCTNGQKLAAEVSNQQACDQCFKDYMAQGGCQKYTVVKLTGCDACEWSQDELETKCQAQGVYGKSSNDLSALAAIQGDNDFSTNMTDAAMAKLGWKRAVVVTYNQVAGASDQVAVYMKDKDGEAEVGECVLTFQGVNDDSDTASIVGGFNPSTPDVDMCQLQVQAGLAQKFNLFLQEPRRAEVVAYLNNKSICRDVGSVGLSMGGTLATLWATCANQGNNTALYGERTDYYLTTFGPVAISKNPPFNGVPGNPFAGTRYCIVGKDGGTSLLNGKTPLDALDVDSETKKLFRMDFLDLSVKILPSIGLSQVSDMIQSTMIPRYRALTSSEIEQDWYSNVLPLGWPSAVSLVAFRHASTGTGEAQTIGVMVAKYMTTGILSFGADLVCSLGQFFGYQHAIQDYQGIPNKLLTKAEINPLHGVPWNVLNPRDQSLLGPILPIGDQQQFLLSTLASGGEFVNHNTCCYVAGDLDACRKQYLHPDWRTCENKLLAYYPKPKKTCSSIKESWKKQGCCGNPSKKFNMDDDDGYRYRRLDSVVDEPMNEDDLINTIRDELKASKARGGKQEVVKTAGQILAVLKEY